MIDGLKRELRNYRTTAIQSWDRLSVDPANLIDRFAMTVDNRQARESTVRLEYAHVRPIVTGWMDEAIVAFGLEKLDWTVPMQGWDTFVAYNKVNIGRPAAVAKLPQIIAALAPAHQNGIIAQFHSAFNSNPVCMDGQNFFDTDHPVPNAAGTTYSNVLAPNWTDPVAPTLAEMTAMLRSARSRFNAINVLDAKYSKRIALSDLTVIVHTEAAAEVATQLLEDREISGTINEYRGSFELIQDNSPTETAYLELIWNRPGSVERPLVFSPETNPYLDTWEGDSVPNGYVAVGLRQQYGVKVGMPWTAIQVRPT